MRSMNEKLLVPKRHVEAMSFDERREFLTQITNRTLDAIARRAHYKQNPVVYEPGALGEGYPSFLEFAVREKEQYYALMGRYRHETQYPITDVRMEGPFNEADDKGFFFRPKITIPGIFDWYQEVVDRFCEPGENPGRAGIVADIDADVMDEMHTRLQFGRYIIDGKIASRPELKEMVEHYTPDLRDDVLSHIIFKEQEARVVKLATDYSDEHHGFDHANVDWLVREYIRINTQVQFGHLKRFYDVDLGELP